MAHRTVQTTTTTTILVTIIFQLIVVHSILVNQLVQAKSLGDESRLDPVAGGPNVSSPENVKRLKQMFEQSQMTALKDLFESNALELFQEANDLTKNRTTTTTETIAGQQQQGELGKSKSKTTDHKDQATAAGKQTKPNIHSKHSGQSHPHSEARQSYLLPGLYSPTSHLTSPLGSGLPNLMGGLGAFRAPSLPTFTVPTQRPPRPAKTSIIGNNGGPMAMTNDNVVVVNVLSGNFR